MTANRISNEQTSENKIQVCAVLFNASELNALSFKLIAYFLRINLTWDYKLEREDVEVFKSKKCCNFLSIVMKFVSCFKKSL